MSTSISVFPGRWCRFLLVLVGMALLAVPSTAFAVTTSQSSTTTGYPSTLAMDANTADSNSTMSQTQSQGQAWWQADLGSLQTITQIKVWARSNLAPTNFWVFISNQPFNTSLLPSQQAGSGGIAWYYNPTGSASRPSTYNVNVPVGVRGRYVMIQLNGTGSLTLAEVEIIAGGGGDTTAPTVSISSPSGGTSYTTAQTVNINATASDNVGVTKVEFYKGGVLQSTDTSSPYAFAWPITSSNNGTHSVTAKAYDVANNNTTSTAVSLTVNIAGSDTTAPTVSISSPSNGSSYTTAQTVNVTATATDNVGVTKVEFYKGGVLQATDTSAPFSFAWPITSSINGSHSFTAKAYDAANNNTTSTAVSLTVNIPASDMTVPTVSISSPSTGTSYTTAQTVNINATASDNVGVTKVEFYKGGVLQATDTSAPFSFAWPITSSINGSHSFTAKAYDAANNNTTSTAVSLTVNIPASGDPTPPQNVWFTSPTPANGASYTTAQTVTLSAYASDNAGGSGMNRVEFYKDGVKQGEDTSPSSNVWSFDWNIASGPNGMYRWTAKAIDNAGNSKDTYTISLTVRIKATPRTMWQPNRVAATYNSGCTSGSAALNDGFIKDNPSLCATNGAITLTFTAPTSPAKVNYVALMGYTGATGPTVTLYNGASCATQAAQVTAVKDLSDGAWEAKFLSPPTGVCRVTVGTASGYNVSELAVYATPWPASGETGWPAVSSPNYPAPIPYASDLTVDHPSPTGTIDDFMAKVLKDNHSELTWVLENAHALLSTGFAAGSGYHIYARDTATFIEEDIRHQPQQNSGPTTSWSAAKDALITLWQNQQASGAIPDTEFGTNFWTTTETDQESSLIRATYLYLTLTNNSNLSLNTSIAGVSLQTRMENALKFVMNNRMAPAYGLVWSGTNVDWGDVELGRNGLEVPHHLFDSTSTPSITAYTNALFVRAVDHFIELTNGTVPAWVNVRNNIKQNMRTYLWDSANLKWYPHRYTVKGPPVNDDVSTSEDPKFYHGGTTVAMQAGLSFPKEKDSMMARMLSNAANAKNALGQNWNPTVGITVDAGYDSFWDPLMFNNVYQDGGDWDWFGGRTDQVMISAGRPEDAWLQLDKSYQRQIDTTHNIFTQSTPTGPTVGFREVWEPHSQCSNVSESPDQHNWGCRSKDVMGWAGELSKAVRMLQRRAQDYRDEKASKQSNTISASSSTAANQPYLAFDENPSTEWAAASGVCAAASITITFPTAHKISGVVLHDRGNTTDQVQSGHIVLTGCSNINVSALEDTGKPYVVDVLASCPDNSTTEVKFVVDSCKSGTQNIGLRDIEIYEENNPVNLARNALTVTASTEFSPSFAATQAINGIYGSSELGGWKSYGESDPWLMLTWDTPRTISRVVVYDGPLDTASEKYDSFDLEFSDASGNISSINMYPTDANFLYKTGAPREVILPTPKTVTWVKFTGNGASGTSSNGLAEFEVFENRNLAYDAMTSASSTYFSSSGGAPLFTVSTYPAFATIDGFVGSDTEGYWQPSGTGTQTVTYTWPKGASKSVRAVEVWDVPNTNNINCARVTFNGSPTPAPATGTSEATCTSNYCDITVIPQNGRAPGKLYLTSAVNVTSVTVTPGANCAASGNKAIAEVRILGY